MVVTKSVTSGQYRSGASFQGKWPAPRPRPAVQQHDGGPLAHLGAVGHECGAFDVEPQTCPFHVDVHATPLPPETEAPALQEFSMLVMRTNLAAAIHKRRPFG